jgi:phage terminase large subunit GpA-like protein
MHFPAGRDLAFFSQLIAERSVRKEAHGQRFRVWELPPGRANEGLDTTVYAYAALCGLQHMGLKLNQRVEGVRTGRVELPPAVMPEPEPPPPVAPGPGVKVVDKGRKTLGSRLAAIGRR